MEIDIDAVESDNEVDKNILRFDRDLSEEFPLEGDEGGELI